MARDISPRLSRRLALLLPLAASGCGIFDENFFSRDKQPLPGKRIDVLQVKRGLVVDNPRNLRITLPQPVPRADWQQAGGIPSHEMGHAQVADTLTQAWKVDIGEGGGYRRKITGEPVVAAGHVFTLDANAMVSAFDATTGSRLWRFDTEPDDYRSTNVGGGIAFSDGVLYAATGRAEVIALDAATGAVKWRAKIDNAARAAPTIAEGKLFVPLLGDKVVALAAEDGKRVWSYQATDAQTSVLGLPSPAYSDGIVVAGFGSGDIVALRAGTGAVIWLDSLASARGRNSGTDLSAITALPIIQDGRVYAVGFGGLMLSLDLRSGRRLWERDVAADSTPCLAGDWLFVLNTDGYLAALNRLDGSVVWVTQLPPFEDMKKKKDPIRWIGPTLAADRLVVVSSNELAMAISPYTGDILGQQKLSGAASLAPTVAMGSVFIVTDDGKLAALR